MITLIISGAAWFAIGVYGHVWWWRRKHDYFLSDIPVSLMGGMLGPFNWIIGWVVCGEDYREGRVLLRRVQRSPQERAEGGE